MRNGTQAGIPALRGAAAIPTRVRFTVEAMLPPDSAANKAEVSEHFCLFAFEHGDARSRGPGLASLPSASTPRSSVGTNPPSSAVEAASATTSSDVDAATATTSATRDAASATTSAAVDLGITLLEK